MRKETNIFLWRFSKNFPKILGITTATCSGLLFYSLWRKNTCKIDNYDEEHKNLMEKFLAQNTVTLNRRNDDKSKECNKIIKTEISLSNFKKLIDFFNYEDFKLKSDESDDEIINSLCESSLKMNPTEFQFHIVSEFLNDFRVFITDTIITLSEDKSKLFEKTGNNYNNNRYRTQEDLFFDIKNEINNFVVENKFRKNYDFLKEVTSKIAIESIIDETAKKLSKYFFDNSRCTTSPEHYIVGIESIKSSRLNYLLSFLFYKEKKNNLCVNESESSEYFDLLNYISSAWENKLYSSIVNYWKSCGYFDEKSSKYSESFIGRHNKPFIGMDIGVNGSLYIFNKLKRLLEEENSLAKDGLEKDYMKKTVETICGVYLIDVINNLNDNGFFIIRNALNKEELAQIKGYLHMSEEEKMAKHVCTSLLSEDANMHYSRFSRGRLVCLLRGTLMSSNIIDYQKIWIPFIHAYFQQKKQNEFIFNPLSESRNFYNIEKKGRKMCDIMRYFVSEIQMLMTDPLADRQVWHRGGDYGSLTVELSLKNMTHESGSLQLYPKSHLLSSKFPANSLKGKSNWKSFLSQSLSIKGPLNIKLNEGDIIIYDSRIIRRTESNDTWKMLSKLVFKYDEDNSQKSIFNRIVDAGLTSILGSSLEFFLQVHRKLFG